VLWGVADLVIDKGDSLEITIRGKLYEIKMDNIANVSVTQLQNPPKITLRLYENEEFGNEVSFLPVATMSLNPFRKNEVAEELVQRLIDKRVKRN
jgi:hypothetical protein